MRPMHANPDDATSVDASAWGAVMRRCMYTCHKVEAGAVATAREFISQILTVYEAFVPRGPCPLFRRGLVLQEQILSRRCLTFGQWFLSWECLCNISSEKWPALITGANVGLYAMQGDPISQMRLAITTQRLKKTQVFDM
jgi:hypothetical protein